MRPDDLAARAIEAAVERTGLDPAEIDDVIFGCTNQAGEDNRNVARMGLLLAGLPVEVPGVTVNRLCASGLEAVSQAARAIRAGEGDLLLAGGVESMSRAPLVGLKPERGFPRGGMELQDTTIGWRFVNPLMRELHGTDSMGETAENVAERYDVSREDQDAFALESHRRAVAAARGRALRRRAGHRGRAAAQGRPDHRARRRGPAPRHERRAPGRAPAGVPRGRHGDRRQLVADQRRRRLPGGGLRREGASSSAPSRWRGSWPPAPPAWSPPTWASARCPPRGWRSSAPGSTIEDIDLVELNEAFAAQVLACIRELGIPHEKLNVNGGAIAIGHPLGASGARLIGTLAHELRRSGGRYGVATMCIGVGQGLATVIENPAA